MAKAKKTVKKSVPTKEVSVIMILDKSGSMQVVRDATISGFNEYVGTLRKDKDVRYKMSLTLFDTELSQVCTNVPLSNMSDLNVEIYKPDGSTALYDAVCRTLNENDGKKSKTICIIMTDGEENSSKEYDEKTMRSKIKELEKLGNWTFVYLGANQDSYKNAQKFGVGPQNVANFNATTRGVSGTFAMMAQATANLASMDTTSSNAFLTRQQQKKLGDLK